MRILLACFLCIAPLALSHAQAPTTIADFFMPGSQPNESGSLEGPSRCMNCHSDYNPSDPRVEPGSNWEGSMMAQAARDPLFYASVAIAEQDAPGSGDFCLRCHTPNGWLGGRSVPTDGSLLTAEDREGVFCDFCHRSIKPTAIGTNPYPGNTYYTEGTYPTDQAYLGTISAHIPPTEANGMYVVDSNSAKRGPYHDDVARHKSLYSPFHRSSDMCGTCHDVSNPVYDRQPDGTYTPNAFGQARTDFSPYQMFPVERTFSEWKVSAYNDGNPSRTCQGCHMSALTGKGADKKDAPLRTDLAWHDMTGGNTWLPDIIPQFYPAEVSVPLLARAKERAFNTLRSAASITPRVEGSELVVRVTNLTGHKLPSGYPEGRRIWLNVKFKNESGILVWESGAYDFKNDTVRHTFGFGSFAPGQVESLSVPTILDYESAKVYEIKPGLSESIAAAVGYTPGPSFHFALNNQIFFDNRIPPAGFTNANFEAIQSEPVGYSYADGQDWDDTRYAIPYGAKDAEITLYYQTASYEYIKFLVEENRTNNWGERLFNAWRNSGHSTPVAMASASIETPFSEEPTFVGSIYQAKNYADGVLIGLGGRTITASFAGKFYIEENDRSSGIGVSWIQTVVEGSAVSVIGRLNTLDGEREILATSVAPSSALQISPLGMSNRALGGGSTPWQQGPAGGVGLNNIGLLIRTTGKVGAAVADGFLLDDGSGVYVEVVAPGLSMPAPGSYVTVTGISGLGTRNSELSRLVRVRRQSDIRIL